MTGSSRKLGKISILYTWSQFYQNYFKFYLIKSEMRLCHALPYRFWELSVPCSFTSGDILVLLKRRKCCIDSSRNILLIDIMDRTHIYTVSIPTYMVQTRVLCHNILTSKHKNYGLWIFIYTFKIQ